MKQAHTTLCYRLAINETTLQICYNAEDLLPLCEELDVPLVFGEILYILIDLRLFNNILFN